MVKTSLFIIIKDRVLTDFQMITFPSEVAAFGSKWPITSNNGSVDYLKALTQNYFLIGKKANGRIYLGEQGSTTHNLYFMIQVEVFTNHILAENTYFENLIE